MFGKWLIAGLLILLASIGGACSNTPKLDRYDLNSANPTGFDPDPLSSKTPRAARQVTAERKPPSGEHASTDAIGATRYKIGPQDVLDISVFKVPELSRSVQVADSGTINLPLVGDLPTAGRTAVDVERDLAQRLGALEAK